MVRYADARAVTRGILYLDQLGPFFDEEGSEIVPLGSEAATEVVELLEASFVLRTNLPLQSDNVKVTFPMLTKLIQSDWDRLTGSNEDSLPARGFLLNYQSSGVAVGRMAEDLLCILALELVIAECWPSARAMAVDDAVDSLGLVMPVAGVRCDDLVVADGVNLTLVESKCTMGRWGHLRRMGAKAVRQLVATAQLNPGVQAGLLIASSLADHQLGLWWASRNLLLASDSRALDSWLSIHRSWRPSER